MNLGLFSASLQGEISDTSLLLNDHDVNSVGWFVDSTPLDNSEFIAQNTDSFLHLFLNVS